MIQSHPSLQVVSGLGLLRLPRVALESLTESSIFMTTGAVISAFPSQFSFIGMKPIINTMIFPIPSALLPSKDTFSYISDVTSYIYQSDIHDAGAAFLNYAELYMMGGWPIVFVGYFILGYLYRRLWIWFTFNSDKPLAQVIYSNSLAFLYIIVSRGYLPQITMIFVFTILPLVFIARIYSRSRIV